MTCATSPRTYANASGLKQRYRTKRYSPTKPELSTLLALVKSGWQKRGPGQVWFFDQRSHIDLLATLWICLAAHSQHCSQGPIWLQRRWNVSLKTPPHRRKITVPYVAHPLTYNHEIRDYVSLLYTSKPLHCQGTVLSHLPCVVIKTYIFCDEIEINDRIKLFEVAKLFSCIYGAHWSVIECIRSDT